MIFAEHKLLLEKVPMLESQISNWEQIDDKWRKSDSIKTQQILYCKQQINESNLSIEHLNSALSKQKKCTYYCCGAAGLVLIICLLMN